MNDVGYRAVLLQVHIEPFGLEVLGHHHARFDDAGLLRQVGLAEALSKSESVLAFVCAGGRQSQRGIGYTYRRAGRIVR